MEQENVADSPTGQQPRQAAQRCRSVRAGRAVSLETFSDAVHALYSPGSLRELGPAVLDAMRLLLDADVYVVNAIDQRQLHALALTWPESVPDVDMNVFNAHLSEHPSLCTVFDPERWPVHKWSDSTTLRQFRQTGLYNDFFRHSGTNFQISLAFSIGAQSNFHAVFNRRQRDFTEADRAVLQLILPHFQQAYRQAVARTELERALAVRELCEAGAASLLVADDGAVLFATEAARRLCRDYFGEETGPLVPGVLHRWLAGRRPEESRCVQTRGERQLNIHCGTSVSLPPPVAFLPAAGPVSARGCLLRMEERVSSPSADALRRLGLTAREAEVLSWIVRGKRNGEIAIILSSQPRTVEKHVENMMAKLGVETRAAAIAMAWETDREAG